ncbi:MULTISPECIES: acyl-CoA dehydrogenase C-terminal domain-containing protein [unclassified Oleiphilus]|nr:MULTISPECIES: acyl-CoA dehydrogenase C-terminal domain-containing protein [unclassified Oleiphilus]KZY86646.1 hypothetical protein A3743_16725 [Oleiphilus sp. HI0072]KZY29114.1 hypothetical protein A3729_01620 [Oleiphilus sp. HI0043]KZZ36512.1 hypothetical protein A3757_02180 [Oleiphilus sp. HI0117]KZZ61928.1 hypothetical protein A3761_03790 [Oleiphilus sp. HI0123]KZZ73500.1 hypothetical protein A3763_08780 [Oleiphilus sp. HI0128]
MSKYCAPITDMKFHIKGNSAIDNDDAGLILDQAAEFSEQVWGSVNQHGDQNGCRYKDGKVLLDPKIRDAFKAFSEAGWMGISMPEEWGGQALPEALSSKVSEMLTSTNQSLCMFTALTSSACKALISFGNDELKQTYLHNMVSGNWTGTMCLTESHCGSDLGEIKSSAKINADNSYAISGTKIFISTGDHDASDNIIHLVLARIKGAPEGIKGLSLFLVPKIFPDNNEYNSLSCIGIEEKMGIHSNPTCTMAFEEAKGFLVGEENGGIKAMFKMMNEMRLGTSLQGVGMSEQSFQASYQYAVERVQGQSLDKKLRGQTTGLIGHADVRRMLLTQKAFAEGGRAFCHYCAELLDREKAGNDAEAAKLLGLLTPIAKAFLTETGQESASLAVQVYGGHGYITETGVEQIYRDGRISTLYEGTTGIQSLDLLGRKVLGDQGQALMLFTKQLHVLSKSILKQDSDTELIQLAEQVKTLSKEWPQMIQNVGMKALQDHGEVGAAAYDFLMYSGYVTLAYFWLEMAAKAEAKLQDNDTTTFSESFLKGKIKTAKFYFARILPRIQAHQAALQSGAESLSLHEEDEWYF